MNLSYRTKNRLKGLGVILLMVLVVAALAFPLWFLWLDRYVIFLRDQGAVLDFSLSQQMKPGVEAKPTEKFPVDIYYHDGSMEENNKELTQLTGYYIERSALSNLTAVRAQLQKLAPGTPVLVDVKNIFGSAYYSSAVMEQMSTDVSISDMDALIEEMDRQGLYLIAKLPALRDRYYGRTHVPDGIYHISRGYLWVEVVSGSELYWLNPNRQGTLSYLAGIVNELKDKGFDEVVLEDFSVPVGEDVYFPYDRAESLSAAAQTLVTACASDTFAVSFVQDMAFTLPQGRSRVYLKNVSASNAAGVVGSLGLEDPGARAVFITDLHDTRFDAYGVLRPLSSLA